MTDKNEIGKIGWIDLTVDDASGLKDFYAAVIGWDVAPVSLGNYDDYCVSPPGSDGPVAGICHRRGPNENIPSQWLMYVTVASLDASIAAVESGKGKVVCAKRDMGSHGTMCIIEDPAGAICALVEPAHN